MLSMPPLYDHSADDLARSAEAFEIDPGIQPLVTALQQIGCRTEASCEGHLRVLASGERCTPRLPYVVFRAPGPLVTDLLELMCELVNRPPSRTRLAYVWYLESCPSLEGGVLHTITPHYAYTEEQLTEADLEAAQRDSRTLAAFLLLRRGSNGEIEDRPDRETETGYYRASGIRRRAARLLEARQRMAHGR